VRLSGRLRRIAGLAAALAAAAGLWAAPAEKKVVILRSGAFPLYDFAVKGFKDELAAKKVRCAFEEMVLPETDADGFIASLRASSPDLVFTIGTLAARMLQEKGQGIPFIYAMIVDPPSLGLTTPGAVMETNPTAQLAFIRENFPKIKRVGLIHSSTRNRDTVRLFSEARMPDMTLVMIPADSPEDMSKAILRLSKEADCLLMVSDALLYSSQTSSQIILQTLQNNLPIIAVSPSFVKAGAMAAIYPDYTDNGVQAGDVAARFFAGEPLSSIPAQWASRTRCAVNLIIAKRLGVAVQDKTLRAAVEVVQ
jgi:ABC-type uncharacterized transport system substrate-binding protein